MKLVRFRNSETGDCSLKKVILVVSYTVLLIACVIRLEAVIALAGRLFSVLFPFLLGAMIAFIVNIPMQTIENLIGKVIPDTEQKSRRGIRRAIAMAVSFLLIFAALGIILTLMIPEIGAAMVSLASGVPAFLEDLTQKILVYFGQNPQIRASLERLTIGTEWENIWDKLLPFVRSGAGNVFESTVSTVSGVFGGLVTAALALMFSIYILSSKEKLGGQAVRVLRAYLSPEKVRKTLRITGIIAKTYSNYFAGQFTDACIFGFLIFLLLTLLSLPYAMLIGVLVAFTALIPIVGAYIGLAIGAFLIAVVNPMYALYFAGVYMATVFVDNNFIYPRVVGSSVGLPAIWVLLAVGVGGGLFGIVGMIFFIPGTSVIYQLIRENVARRLEARGEETAS
ncbi:Predicted PurR-regulated permease PerM [[Clostridium] aminophilum]|uniref:Predicted PurR-regulated permease PerM n=1 Tax=[Clostridium] aminophilum TaxID=1526 RepID=A0A1I0BLP7_9FIRM|nr:AI-2E family transporter [[Clostridium] aminophilum]SET07518.1 Predicted PurR-regulated permease PerM [[Clostridium] aminophilum]